MPKKAKTISPEVISGHAASISDVQLLSGHSSITSPSRDAARGTALTSNRLISTFSQSFELVSSMGLKIPPDFRRELVKACYDPTKCALSKEYDAIVVDVSAMGRYLMAPFGGTSANLSSLAAIFVRTALECHPACKYHCISVLVCNIKCIVVKFIIHQQGYHFLSLYRMLRCRK